MKTTVEILDQLFREAKEYAVSQGIPLREVFARGLRMVLAAAPIQGGQFRLKMIATEGEGAVSEDWSRIRSTIYDGHGE